MSRLDHVIDEMLIATARGTSAEEARTALREILLPLINWQELINAYEELVAERKVTAAAYHAIVGILIYTGEGEAGDETPLARKAVHWERQNALAMNQGVRFGPPDAL